MKERNTYLSAWAQSVGIEQASDVLGVSHAAIYHWMNGTRRIGADRVLDVESKTGISRHYLRPDIFGPARNAAI